MAVVATTAAAAAAVAEAAAEPRAEAAAVASVCWHLRAVSAEAETVVAEPAALAQSHLHS